MLLLPAKEFTYHYFPTMFPHPLPQPLQPLSLLTLSLHPSVTSLPAGRLHFPRHRLLLSDCQELPLSHLAPAATPKQPAREMLFQPASGWVGTGVGRQTARSSQGSIRKAQPFLGTSFSQLRIHPARLRWLASISQGESCSALSSQKVGH